MGSPESISAPISAALGERFVYILEPRRRQISVWNRSGELVERLDVPMASDLISQVRRVDTPDGRSVRVVTYAMNADGAAAWTLISYASGEAVTIDSIPVLGADGLFREPHYLSVNDAAWRVDPIDLTFAPFPADERTTMQWTDAPAWLVPGPQRADYERIRSQMPPDVARRSRLPAHWPTLQEIDAIDGGRLVVEVSAGEDVTHVIVLGSDLEPIARLSDRPFRDPVFLGGGRVFQFSEELNATIVHEILFPQ
ncbi:MAG: hypothetical protein RQ745_11220 [Longimicrobiales bacterium]|nr:hypothetical protein [Longimicrobiales bacterium]